MTPPPLTITLHSATRATCGEHEVRHRDPEFAMARVLVAAGYDPAQRVRTMRAHGTPSLSGILGRWARLKTEEPADGCIRFRPWSAMCPETLGRVRQDGVSPPPGVTAAESASAPS